MEYSDKIAVHLTGIVSDLNMPILKADRIINYKKFSDYTAGDVNNDGKINILDLIVSKEMLLDTETDIITGAYDCNFDDAFDISDVMELTAFLLGKRTIEF